MANYARGVDMAVYCPVGELYVVIANGTAACPHCGKFQHYVDTDLTT